MKAAIYARYSSDLQRATSLDDQIRLCQEEAARRGYSVAKVFTDAALSGTLDERQRPGFAAMLDAAKQRTFDVLITDEMSRLSRDQADGLKILDRLEHWGIGLVTRDGTDTVSNPNTRLVAGMKAVMADEENRAKAQRTWRGLQGTALRGYSPGGLPYGYRSQPEFDGRGKIAGYRKVIHEGEAEIVRRIFACSPERKASVPIPLGKSSRC
jgi:DNA invertase Pin-like site-specific DNA recombinase